ncbi:Cro/CI family transcriptional regulator [Craterilacuibacter sinensis]|uniref:Cro/Cl family transcriptional regulator n=1 Tax=Craterilacuibacter sinensis TaxID=2686017 RepID=A0A845BPT8_9NEIS|nr:Cro/Cl family transcriptional regulator [Craterilacuibacter sinensis]
MKKTTALNYFGSQAALAKAAEVNPSAVSQWGDDVPNGSAYVLVRCHQALARLDRKEWLQQSKEQSL